LWRLLQAVCVRQVKHLLSHNPSPDSELVKRLPTAVTILYLRLWNIYMIAG